MAKAMAASLNMARFLSCESYYSSIPFEPFSVDSFSVDLLAKEAAIEIFLEIARTSGSRFASLSRPRKRIDSCAKMRFAKKGSGTEPGRWLNWNCRREEFMNKEVAGAIAELKAQGIPVAVDPPGGSSDVYIATAPDGEKYKFTAAGLLDLKAKGRLHLEGLQEAHFAKKDIPNFHNPSGT
jgi:hypothetical protein